MRPGEPLAALEGLRGYAAFLVFLVHAFGLLAVRLYGIDPDSHEVLRDGDPGRTLVVLLARSHYGVDLFFVLSGLLMADLALRRWPGTARFLARRWLRIYPAYLGALALAGGIAASWLGMRWSAADLAANLAVLQGFFVLGFTAVNPVSWSLSYEVAFYLAIPLFAAWCKARGAPGPGALAAAFVLAIGVSMVLPSPKAPYLAYSALFVPGIALGTLDDAGRASLARRLPLAAVLSAWIVFTLAAKLGWLSNLGPAYYAASALACGLVVLKACDEEGPFARALASPVACWLGRHSYSFFLVHYIVVHRWGGWLAERVPVADRVAYSALLVSGSLALSLAVARLLWLAAERFYFRRAAARPRG